MKIHIQQNTSVNKQKYGILSKARHPFIQLESVYQEPIGIVSVTIYGFDGNSVDMSDDIRDESYKETHPWAEELLIACNVID